MSIHVPVTACNLSLAFTCYTCFVVSKIRAVLHSLRPLPSINHLPGVMARRSNFKSTDPLKNMSKNHQFQKIRTVTHTILILQDMLYDIMWMWHDFKWVSCAISFWIEETHPFVHVQPKEPILIQQLPLAMVGVTFPRSNVSCAVRPQLVAIRRVAEDDARQLRMTLGQQWSSVIIVQWVYIAKARETAFHWRKVLS